MKKIGMVFLWFLFVSPSFADMIPGPELGYLINLLNEAREQSKNFKENLQLTGELKAEAEKTVKGINQQIDKLEAANKMMQSHHGYSKLFDNPSLKKWQHSGTDFDSFLNSHEGNSGALSVYAKKLAEEFNLKNSGDVYSKTQSKEQLALYDAIAKTAIASGAQSEMSYSQVDDIIKMLEKLQEEIDRSENQKATLDLIARVGVENAKINAMHIKNEAAMAKMSSLNLQQNVSDAKWASEFLKWK